MSGSAVGGSAAAAAAAYIRQRVGTAWQTPVAGIVLGSGLGGLADRLEQPVRIPFSHVPGFPTATVAGHAGQLMVGTLASRPVVLLAGRFHMYEGHAAGLAAFPVRVLHALGAPVYIASNAAGGVRRTFTAGDLMLIADHMNLMFRNPLVGPTESGDERFPDMSDPYDPALRALMRDAATAVNVPLHEGVYCGLLGPTYETPAEVRMLERLGADAVGMSTVPEVIMARAIGMRAVAVSCITNKAAGLSHDKLSHQEVMDAGKAVASRFEGLITEFVRRV
ncbi:purine-nucleoside phosphorylase [Gemmatimonas phototrophica]|uniref:Purine nucleoside phosphorylase n=1 Tax=Gemmatimonas phototrophica TaxID=1379270 RepID=A0A143BJQ6_9BACT|nr:purine-nucleoside phosphorylase [Gemmatimonas phototrophica]AMW05307.1 purine nucleoside phosphorylase [Gemmatimonas phototrophica]